MHETIEDADYITNDKNDDIYGQESDLVPITGGPHHDSPSIGETKNQSGNFSKIL